MIFFFFDGEEKKTPKILSENVNAIKPHMVATTKMEV